MAAQVKTPRWSLRCDCGPVSREEAWDQVSEDFYSRADEDRAEVRCAIVISSDPYVWQAEVDAIDVAGHAAIRAPTRVLLDARVWARTRLRPHTVLVVDGDHAVALVTRGRWPGDRALRLVLL